MRELSETIQVLAAIELTVSRIPGRREYGENAFTEMFLNN